MNEDNRRIAKNTLLLYCRTFITVIVGIYTSRIMLEALGIDNYGIQNVVGGIVAMTGMISGALTVSSGRFITFALGKNDLSESKKVFTTSLAIQVIIAAIVVLALESIGLWYLNYKANIPSDRMVAANWVFQCSIISSFIRLSMVPFSSTIVAHEKMSIYAYMSIINVTTNLVIVELVYFYQGDRLIFLSILTLINAVANNSFYVIYCKRKFKEVTFSLRIDRKLVKEMASFSGWAFWGNGVVVLKDVGTNLVVNFFLGVAVNAAVGVATTVTGTVMGFIRNFTMAVNPQITKSYSSGRHDNMRMLICKSGRISSMLMMLIAFPLCFNINYILGLWLVEVPQYANIFIVLSIIYCTIDVIVSPLLAGLLATGKIRSYEIELTITYILNFALSFILLWRGFNPAWIYVNNIIFKGVVLYLLLLNDRSAINLSIKYFRNECLKRIVLVAVVGCTVFLIISPVNISSFKTFIVWCCLDILLIGLIIWTLGLNAGERGIAVGYIKNRYNRFRLKYKKV